MGNDKPRFYLKVLNGHSMSFGIQVFLGSNHEQELFSQYTNSHYDNRRDLFKKFVLNENLGLLDFTFEIYHSDTYVDNQNIGKQDCRNWIWEYNGLRNRVMAKKVDDTFSCGGNVIIQ